LPLAHGRIEARSDLSHLLEEDNLSIHFGELRRSAIEIMRGGDDLSELLRMVVFPGETMR